jgi:endonuclease YncB( thermonuclease family)
MKSYLGIMGLALGLTAGQSALADPCTAPLPSRGTDFSGQVRYVGDGDSLCVGQSSEPNTWIEVRVADFYAPELHSPGGPQAKAALQRIAMGQVAQCKAGHRSYDRIVARCIINGESIGGSLRRAGIQEGGRGH